MAWNPKNPHIMVSGSDDGKIRVWSSEKWAKEKNIKEENTQIIFDNYQYP